MEDDDEFGDLYTDVLRPLATQFQPHHEEAGSSAPGGKAAASSQGRPIDLNINSDDEEILYGAPDLKKSDSNSNSNINRSSSALRWNLNAPIQGRAVSEPRGFDLNINSDLEAANNDGLAENREDDMGIEARVFNKGEGVKSPQKASGGSTFLENDDDDDINIILEERENKDEDFLEKDDNSISKEDDAHISGTQKDPTIGSATESAVEGMDSEQMIPGLSGRLDNPRDSHFDDDWESEESEDDLRIVLNDNSHGMTGMIDEDDGDGEQLVIFADNGDVGHHHQQPQQTMIEEPEWGGEEGGPGADGDKDLGDAAKASGGGGGGAGAAPIAVQPKIAYSNHGFHHPFHSQFKYVRPGAAPLPGAAPGGIPGPIRPPVNMGPPAGRGRGDWRPAGMKGPLPMQKGFHPGYGIPAGRGYGSGLDFTLPSHKTIFEVDIDSFEEKPWKLPSIDVSDFFNFGLDEDSWKDYCKQLEQLRLETTMQSKIRVYESGRAERDYDPDLPPELAAAVGIQDIPPENANPGNTDAALTDVARASANGRSPIPVGRPIPVEAGSGDRTPSIDSTKRVRMHDADAIIEIVCQGSIDDDEEAEQQDNESARKDLGGGDETDDCQQDDADHRDSFSPAYNGQKTESGSRRAQLKNAISTDRDSDTLHEERRDGKTSPTSSPSATESDRDQAPVGDEMNDGPVSDDTSFDMERKKKDVDTTTGDTPEDGNLSYPTKKHKLGSLVEQLSQEDDDDAEDSKAARSSETSKARSGSSKDFGRLPDDVEDEVLQDKRPPRAGVTKREVGNDRRKGHYKRDETERHVVAEGREYSLPHKSGGEGNSSLHRHVKTENTEWNKEGDISEGSWHRRDADYRRGRTRDRSKARESDKSEKDENHQSRNQMDNGNSWRGPNHDHNITGSRPRERDDALKSRNENVDALQGKRRKEEARVSQERFEKEDISDNHRENGSRRKRERDDGSDQLKRDDRGRLKEDDVHSNARQKEGGLFQRERIERQRERDEWYRIKQEEVLLREREMRSGRIAEEKPRMSHSRGKDDYTGSRREYHSKDVYARGNQFSNDEKRARYERPNSRDVRVTYGSDNPRVHEEKWKESSRKSKEFEGGDRSSLNPYKRNQNEHGGQMSKKVNSRGRTEQQRGEVDINHPSSKKHREEASSDDEQLDAKKGRSKLERWTSHKERDFGGPTMISSSSKSRNPDTYISSEPSIANKPPEESSGKIQDKLTQPLVEDYDTVPEMNTNVNPKATEDKHLDTFEKLKKRSERFKLPMRNEKDAAPTVKKVETEQQTLPLGQTETRPTDSDIKSERPARKRRWTGN